jgi:hypothetical protein
MIDTCELHGINPDAYLKGVLVLILDPAKLDSCLDAALVALDAPSIS